MCGPGPFIHVFHWKFPVSFSLTIICVPISASCRHYSLHLNANGNRRHSILTLYTAIVVNSDKSTISQWTKQYERTENENTLMNTSRWMLNYNYNILEIICVSWDYLLFIMIRLNLLLTGKRKPMLCVPELIFTMFECSFAFLCFFVFALGIQSNW